MRKIIVVSARDNSRKEVMSDATTWGALQPALDGQNISTTDMKAILRETKTALESNDSVLPTGEFTLFLTPGKVKSGVKC